MVFAALLAVARALKAASLAEACADEETSSIVACVLEAESLAKAWAPEVVSFTVSIAAEAVFITVSDMAVATLAAVSPGLATADDAALVTAEAAEVTDAGRYPWLKTDSEIKSNYLAVGKTNLSHLHCRIYNILRLLNVSGSNSLGLIDIMLSLSNGGVSDSRSRGDSCVWLPGKA